MEELTKALEMKKQLLTVYHPQMDGQTERINQEIEMFLQYYVNYQQDNWMEWIATTEFQYNNKKHMAIKRTSFELNFGRHLQKGDLMVQSEIPRVEEFLTGIQKSWEQTMKAMEEAQKNIKQQFDKKR